MPFIVGTLTDRMGNIIPNQKVVAQQANSGSPDVGQATSDQFGNYAINVSESGTEYDLWIESVSGIESSNYIGRRISSGDIVGSFSLCTDAGFKLEHYGDDGVCGKHKDSTHDSVLLNNLGYIKSFNNTFRIKIGGDSNLFYFVLEGSDTALIQASGNLSHTGLWGTSANKFYFGTAKVRYIDGSGAFNLLGGSFNGAVTFANSATFSQLATFSPNASYWPRLSSYTPSTTITDASWLIPKGYLVEYVASKIPGAPNEITQTGGTPTPTTTFLRVTDSGSNGQALLNISGTPFFKAIAAGFSFGGDFNAQDLVHLRKSGVTTRLRVERIGAGASATVLSENSVGTITSNNFIFLAANTTAGFIDTSQRWSFGVAGSLVEKVNIGGNMSLTGYIHFDAASAPADPTDVDNEARMYLKQRDSANNEIACKIKKNNAIAEVLMTCPQGKCRICGTEGNARDPYYDTTGEGKMILEFLCGHKFEIKMNFQYIGE